MPGLPGTLLSSRSASPSAKVGSPPQGGVHPGVLPAGRVAHVVHAGSYDRLGETWGLLGAWIAEQGLTPGAELWEVYMTEPTPDMDPSALRTELFWTVQ